MSPCSAKTHRSLALFHINLVPQHNKGKVVWVPGRGLDQEFVSPAVERIEALGVVDIVDEHAAVGAAVKGNAE